MNIDTVSPIPQSMHTAANDFQLHPLGIVTILHLMAAHEKVNTPMNLPRISPHITDRPTPFIILQGSIDEKSIPTLANANIGMTKKPIKE